MLRCMRVQLASVSLAILFLSYHVQSAEKPATADLSELQRRGAYVATAAGCDSCHTTPHGAAYAGGAALKTPFGDIYPPNITPDTHDGIGTWSQAEFNKALREGVAKNGEVLYPAMPYTHYTRMSDADLAALWEYIRTRKAVKHAVPANTFRFPFNVRPALSVWQSLYFHPGRLEPDPKRSAEFNRGAYLVNALGHCGVCHTPKNLAQAPVSGRELGGAEISGWYAPDISASSSSALQEWSQADLVRFFKTGARGENTKTVGPMQDVVHGSLRLLTDADRQAIAVYLKQQPAPASSAEVKTVALPTERLEAGRVAYVEHCSTCHQRNGAGQPGIVPALADNPVVSAREPDNVIMAMLEGFKPQGSWGAMASFADTLSNQQIADIANYVRVAWNNGAEPNATEWSIDRWRSLAQPAGAGQSAGLLCPNLSRSVLEPALHSGSDALRRSASDDGQLHSLVQHYREARPGSSQAQVIEALSTAYCREMSAEGLSRPRAAAAIARFTQRLASASSAH